MFVFNDVLAVTNTTSVINSLTNKIRTTIKKYPGLLCGIYIKSYSKTKNSLSQEIININGDSQFAAASLIKIPIAIVLLKKIDSGEISWNETLILKKHHYAQGAGFIRTRKAGTKIKLREVFKLMLTISDNTGTNMVIDRLGGVNKTHSHIVNLGLKNTKLVNWLGDFKGTNKTSPHDLIDILDRALESNFLSNDSRQILKNTLLNVKNKSLINKGLGKYTKFPHKTGTIGICIGDAGIVYLPWNKKFGISIIVKRPFNSLQGQRIIREISSLVYSSLK